MQPEAMDRRASLAMTGKLLAMAEVAAWIAALRSR